MSEAPTLRDVTNEVPAAEPAAPETPTEIALPEKYAGTFDYLSEQIAGFEEQFKGLEQAHRLANAMRNDVLARGAKDLELDPAKWRFESDRKVYVPIEEKKEG